MTKKPFLSKEEELEIAKGMSDQSDDLLYTIICHRQAPRIVEKVSEELRSGDFPVSYMGFSRNNLRIKNDLITYLSHLCEHKDVDRVKHLAINHNAAQLMAQLFRTMVPQDVVICNHLEQGINNMVALRNRLLEANIKIVPYMTYLIRKYNKIYSSMDDMKTLGYEAIVTASGRYDHRVGVKFVHFARAYVFRSILSVQKEDGSVTIPEQVFREKKQATRKERALEQKLGRLPTSEELETETGVRSGTYSGYNIFSNGSMSSGTTFHIDLDESDLTDDDSDIYSEALLTAIHWKMKELLTDEEIQILTEEFLEEIPAVNDRDQKREIWEKIWKAYSSMRHRSNHLQ